MVFPTGKRVFSSLCPELRSTSKVVSLLLLPEEGGTRMQEACDKPDSFFY